MSHIFNKIHVPWKLFSTAMSYFGFLMAWIYSVYKWYDISCDTFDSHYFRICQKNHFQPVVSLYCTRICDWRSSMHALHWNRVFVSFSYTKCYPNDSICILRRMIVYSNMLQFTAENWFMNGMHPSLFILFVSLSLSASFCVYCSSLFSWELFLLVYSFHLRTLFG